jgi:tetratricopeptide (TPR) repeat protein
MAYGQSSELDEAYNTFNSLYQQGRYSEAVPYAKDALRLGEEAFGPNDPTTATILNNLAGLHIRQGKYAEAEPLYTRALAIVEKALGPEHPNVAQSLENYAGLLRETGRVSKPDFLETRAKAIRTKYE